MKKLTTIRREIVLDNIKIGFAAYSLYMERKLSTFTDEGRKVIEGYWNAQKAIADAIGTSSTRTENLIMGRATLSDYYDENGNPLKKAN